MQYIVQRLTILCLLLMFMTLPTLAQSETIIAVQSEETAVETGQYYTVSIILRDAVEVWQINAELQYDPALIYVVGTVSGQPMIAGDFFGQQPTLLVRNGISAGNIVYTQSLVSPANPQEGSGTVATFQIYPLSAGTAQISFTAADLTKINFTESADGNRDVESTENLPVLPAFAEFTITGETVSPPDESTPTPIPTETQAPLNRDVEFTEEAPLVNVTLAPEVEPVPTLIPELEDNSAGGLPILPIAIGLLAVGGFGIGALFIMSRRK